MFDFRHSKCLEISATNERMCSLISILYYYRYRKPRPSVVGPEVRSESGLHCYIVNFLTCHISLGQWNIRGTRYLYENNHGALRESLEKNGNGNLLVRKIRIIATHVRLITAHFGTLTLKNS